MTHKLAFELATFAFILGVALGIYFDTWAGRFGARRFEYAHEPPLPGTLAAAKAAIRAALHEVVPPGVEVVISHVAPTGNGPTPPHSGTDVLMVELVSYPRTIPKRNQ
jgi:hypothetical protein